jgi:hypothetical protein
MEALVLVLSVVVLTGAVGVVEVAVVAVILALADAVADAVAVMVVVLLVSVLTLTEPVCWVGVWRWAPMGARLIARGRGWVSHTARHTASASSTGGMGRGEMTHVGGSGMSGVVVGVDAEADSDDDDDDDDSDADADVA